MKLGEFVEAAQARPELFDRELIIEHVPDDVTAEQLLFAEVEELRTVWVGPC